MLAEKSSGKPGARYPAGLGVSQAGQYLYVVENVGDSLAVVDLANSKVVQRFPIDHYPYAVEVTSAGKVFVSAWGADTLMEFQSKPDGLLAANGKLKVGPRPSALVSNRNGSRLFAALAGVDQIAVIDTKRDKVLGYLSDAAPAGPSEGSTPNGLALSQDESQLFVAEANNNSIAIFDVTNLPGREKSALLGRIPTDWYPTAVLDLPGQLLILTGKGHGSHANPDGATPGEGIKRPFGYDLGQLNGTLRMSPDRFSLVFWRSILGVSPKRTTGTLDHPAKAILLSSTSSTSLKRTALTTRFWVISKKAMVTQHWSFSGKASLPTIMRRPCASDFLTAFSPMRR